MGGEQEWEAKMNDRLAHSYVVSKYGVDAITRSYCTSHQYAKVARTIATESGVHYFVIIIMFVIHTFLSMISFISIRKARSLDWLR